MVCTNWPHCDVVIKGFAGGVSCGNGFLATWYIKHLLPHCSLIYMRLKRPRPEVTVPCFAKPLCFTSCD